MMRIPNPLFFSGQSKTFMKTKSIFFKIIMLFSVSFIMELCSKKDDPAIPLLANAGPDATGEVDQVYTLNGSASTGPAGFTYQWTFSGNNGGNTTETQIAFQRKKQAKPTFKPTINGIYNFHFIIKTPRSEFLKT